jgi:predicted NAD/FAD-binding protein
MFNYEHPIYNIESLRGQTLIKGLQAKNKILYTGAHLGFGFHEDGVVSAIEALSLINILPPWQEKQT